MYQLRDVSENDFEFVYALDKKVMKKYVELNKPWDEAGQRSRFDVWFHKDQQKQIIEVAGQPVGVICTTRDNHNLHIESIELDPEVQSKGIGSDIIRTLIAEALQNKESVDLYVFKANQGAINLYKRLGFTIVGDRDEERYKMELNGNGN